MSDLIEQDFMEPERLMTEQELHAYEFTIERGIQTYIEVGSALKKIRDMKGYRFTHGTFAEYVESRWKMSISSAYNNIAAAKVIENVHPGGQIGFKQAVAIGTLKPEQQREFVATHDIANMTKRETEEAVSEWKRRAEEAERQLKQAQRESAATREQAQSIIERDRQLREENERLKAQKNPEPKVVEKVVQVAPPDYERVIREHQELNNRNVQLARQIDEIQHTYEQRLRDVKDGDTKAAKRQLRQALDQHLQNIQSLHSSALFLFQMVEGEGEAVKMVRSFLTQFDEVTTKQRNEWSKALQITGEDDAVWYTV